MTVDQTATEYIISRLNLDKVLILFFFTHIKQCLCARQLAFWFELEKKIKEKRVFRHKRNLEEKKRKKNQEDRLVIYT